MGKTIKKIFTEEELKQIPQMYKDGISIKRIARQMKCSDKRINEILLNNDINISNPNCCFLKHKPIGYWNNKEHCEEVAKTCRNRGEFSKKYVTAYQYSKQNGWIKDFDQYFSLEKQFYGYDEKIHYVYSYEILEKNAVYVGRTMDLKRRHASHKRGDNYCGKRHRVDTIWKFCNENGIDMPEPKILESGLTATESRRGEDKWVKKYQDDGWNVLNRAATGEGTGSLGSTSRKWTYDTCRDAAAHCISKIDFKKKFSTAYRVSVQSGWINDFFTSLTRESGYFDVLENCISESKKYKSLVELRKAYPFLYHKICDHKWNDDICKANGWLKLGEVKKDRIKDTASVSENKADNLSFIDIELKKMSAFEVKIFYHIRHFECKLLDGSIYGVRLNFLVNNSVIIGVDTLHSNLEFTCGTSHMVFLNELIKYNEMGYPMIHIFEPDVEYENILLDKIDTFIGNTYGWDIINAKECEIKEVRSSDANVFLNMYHIQGETKASVYLGAYKGKELVGIMCFKHVGVNDGEWELTRYTTEVGKLYHGIGGKLLRHFIDKYNPNEIISYGDRRYIRDINNTFYTKNGFIIDRVGRPEYKYVEIEAKVPRMYHKLYFNKKKLNKKYGFPMTMTETEMARELGYDRIWDCGLIKYVWKRESGE